MTSYWNDFAFLEQLLYVTVFPSSTLLLLSFHHIPLLQVFRQGDREAVLRSCQTGKRPRLRFGRERPRPRRHRCDRRRAKLGIGAGQAEGPYVTNDIRHPREKTGHCVPCREEGGIDTHSRVKAWLSEKRSCESGFPSIRTGSAAWDLQSENWFQESVEGRQLDFRQLCPHWVVFISASIPNETGIKGQYFHSVEPPLEWMSECAPQTFGMESRTSVVFLLLLNERPDIAAPVGGGRRGKRREWRWQRAHGLQAWRRRGRDRHRDVVQAMPFCKKNMSLNDKICTHVSRIWKAWQNCRLSWQRTKSILYACHQISPIDYLPYRVTWWNQNGVVLCRKQQHGHEKWPTGAAAAAAVVLVVGHVAVAARRRRVGRGDAPAAARGEAEDTAVQACRVVSFL